MTSEGPRRKSHALYLDLQIAQSPLYPERGSIRYAIEHARAMLRVDGMVRGIGFNPMAPLPARLHPDISAFSGIQWSTSRNFRRAQRHGPLAYYIMSPFAPSRPEYLLPPFAVGPETPMLVTLVDLTPLTSDDPFFAQGEVARRYRSRLQLVEQADLILTISENTRKEAIALLDAAPQKVVTIGTGVSERFVPAVSRDEARRVVSAHLPGITKPFVLAVTGTWEWKNTHRLIEAYAVLPKELKDRFQLVIVCRLTDEYRSRWLDLAGKLGVSGDDLVLTDLVPDAVLAALYQTADLFVFPSLYEGFGLPAAEAAACGCPTITSNTSSMPEILDLPEATFDPSDTSSISGLIERALVDPEFNLVLRKVAASARSRHTWDAVARRTADALGLLPQPVQAVSGGYGRRPRVAIAHSVLAAQPNQDTLLSLAKEMASLCDLDLLALSGQDRAFMKQVAGARCFPLDALGEQLNPAGYDAIIYGLGPNGHRDRIEDKALRYPGILWVGDLSASDCHPRFGHGPGLVTKAVGVALGVIGGSSEQLRLLELDQGPGANMPPAMTLAAGSEPRPAARQIVEFVEVVQRDHDGTDPGS